MDLADCNLSVTPLPPLHGDPCSAPNQDTIRKKADLSGRTGWRWTCCSTPTH
jgi:hypothetical protein